MSQPVVLIAEELSPATIEALGPDFDVRNVDGTDRDALFAALAEANAAARAWMDQVNTAVHSEIHAVPNERLAVEQQQPLPVLGGRKDLAALSYAMSPEFLGDRVGAFIYAIGSMLVTAHGNRTEFYMTDAINPTFVHNAARNIEKATWILSQRQNTAGQPLFGAALPRPYRVMAIPVDARSQRSP